MRKETPFILAVVLAASILSLFSSLAIGTSEERPDKLGTVYTIKISGEVSPGLAAFVKRALADIPEENYDHTTIVFEMDTFGGRVDSALTIVDLIANTKKGQTIAFVTQKAISAGALIALACDELVMKPGTTIGDCAPIMVGNDGPEMLGEKFQSPLRAKFRSLAKKNGYSEVLAEAMVTAEKEIYQVTREGQIVYLEALEFEELSDKEKESVTSKKTVVAKGELLTMDDVEAQELGFSEMTTASTEEMLSGLGISHKTMTDLEPDWAESLLRFIGTLAPLLMMIGLGAIYTEIKAPGFGVPGIVGVICLALFFMHQYTLGLADYTELLVVLLGLVLIGLELFVIPGFGLAGISGGLCLIIGLVLSLQGFVLPDPALPWQMDLLVLNLTVVLGATLSAFFVSMGLLRYVIPKVALVTNRSPYLTKTLKESHADSKESASASLGDRGIAQTPLRPSGKMTLGQARYDVITAGEFLEKGTPVIITKIRGNVLVVAPENDKKMDDKKAEKKKVEDTN